MGKRDKICKLTWMANKEKRKYVEMRGIAFYISVFGAYCKAVCFS